MHMLSLNSSSLVRAAPGLWLEFQGEKNHSFHSNKPYYAKGPGFI